VGVVMLFIGATGVFAEIQDSINQIWSLKAKPKNGVIKYLTNRFLSFSLIVSFGLLFIVS
jgi:membrane protein